MKKCALCLTIMVLTSLSAIRAQTYISGYSSYIGDDGEWTEWIEENVEIKIDIKGSLITVFDPIWLTSEEYKIIRKGESVTDEDDDIVTSYECIDHKEARWTVNVIDLVTTDPGKLQISFSNDTASTSYHVMKAEQQ